MPSFAAHAACAKTLADALKIDCDEFYYGNIFPDLSTMNNSHYRVQGKIYLIPDISAFFADNVCTARYLKAGALAHLLLDKYYLDDYLPKLIEETGMTENLFASGLMYTDYRRVGYKLFDEYSIDKSRYDKILQSVKSVSDPVKWNKYVKGLYIPLCNEETIYLNYNRFKQFLVNIFPTIACEVEKNVLKV